MSPSAPDLVWWISAVELPALAGLFWLLLRARRDGETALAATEAATEASLGRLREALADFKLEVARTYASLDHLRAVEHRLAEHLVRIEAKLDQFALVRREDRS